MTEAVWKAVRPMFEMALRDWGHTARAITLVAVVAVIALVIHHLW